MTSPAVMEPEADKQPPGQPVPEAEAFTSGLYKLRFFDFLFPTEALRKTNAYDNPLVLWSQRRMRRFGRVLGRIAADVLVFLGLICVLSERWAKGLGLPEPDEVSAFGYVLLAFVLLRYHLFVNDQSHHMKALSRWQLEHLLLTRMGPNEFFLHHFLLFCRRYSVLVMVAVIFGFELAADILAKDYGNWRGNWVNPDYYRGLISILALVLLTWFVGAQLYVREWRRFAGGHLGRWRFLLSLLSSGVVAAVLGLLGFAVRTMPPIVGLVSAGMVLPVYAFAVFRSGRSAYEFSETRLWNEFAADDPDYVRTRWKREKHFGAFELLLEILLPSRWGRKWVAEYREEEWFQAPVDRRWMTRQLVLGLLMAIGVWAVCEIGLRIVLIPLGELFEEWGWVLIGDRVETSQWLINSPGGIIVNTVFPVSAASRNLLPYFLIGIMGFAILRARHRDLQGLPLRYLVARFLMWGVPATLLWLSLDIIPTTLQSLANSHTETAGPALPTLNPYIHILGVKVAVAIALSVLPFVCFASCLLARGLARRVSKTRSEFAFLPALIGLLMAFLTCWLFSVAFFCSFYLSMHVHFFVYFPLSNLLYSQPRISPVFSSSWYPVIMLLLMDWLLVWLVTLVLNAFVRTDESSGKQ